MQDKETIQDKRTILVTYRTEKLVCFVYRDWYVVKGSQHINRTWNEIEAGMNLERLNDRDTITSRYPINSIKKLIDAVDSYLT